MVGAQSDDADAVASRDPDPDAEDDPDHSDEASRESFPSSDPPASWAGKERDDR